jgi:hypothetical protein
MASPPAVLSRDVRSSFLLPLHVPFELPCPVFWAQSIAYLDEAFPFIEVNGRSVEWHCRPQAVRQQGFMFFAILRVVARVGVA